VLQHAGPTIDVDTLTREARAAAVAEGIPGHVDEIVASARAALDAPVVRQAHAAARRWHELFVTAPVADGAILEGYVDLLADTPDGLLLIDYKTDRLSVDELDAAAAGYRLQAAAYALALESATGRPVASCTFVFALPDGAHERVVDDLHAAIDQVRSVVNAG
jgi:ATP-dependent helicase/nuclease subunit A